MVDRVGLGIDDIIGDNRECVLRVAATHNATRVRVFGSVARGEARPNTDVDFLAEFQADYTLWDRIALMNDLTDLLGRAVHVVPEDVLRKEFRASVIREAVSL